MKNKLIPFDTTPLPLEITVESIFDSSQNLTVTYHLKGRIDQIHLLDSSEESSQIPAVRTHELWKSTCFEWFLKSPTFKKYWEFNASPNGAWNFYSLDDYRTHLQESTEAQLEKRIRFQKISQEEAKVFVEISLQKLMNHSPELLKSNLFAITAVIHWKSNLTSYFSLKHPQDKPDFHHQDGFILNL